ncbi:Nn.00g094610.m01.CDS01 [Neocucurbitaria sp. VM-36]
MVSAIFSAGIAFMITAVSASTIPTAAMPPDCIATEINTTCFGLKAYSPVCIGVPGFVSPGLVPSGAIFTRDETPVPVQPEIVANCKKFEYTDKDGNPGLAAIFSQNRITKSQWNQWNWPHNDTSKDLPVWAGYFSCMGV